MQRSSHLLTLVLALFAALTLGTATDAVAKGGHAPAPKNKAKEEAHHNTIEAISADSITVKESKESKTFKITKDTELTFKGQKVKLEELKTGMRVSVSAAGDPKVAARIAAEEAPKHTSSGAKK